MFCLLCFAVLKIQLWFLNNKICSKNYTFFFWGENGSKVPAAEGRSPHQGLWPGVGEPGPLGSPWEAQPQGWGRGWSPLPGEAQTERESQGTRQGNSKQTNKNRSPVWGGNGWLCREKWAPVGGGAPPRPGASASPLAVGRLGLESPLGRGGLGQAQMQSLAFAPSSMMKF